MRRITCLFLVLMSLAFGSLLLVAVVYRAPQRPPAAPVATAPAAGNQLTVVTWNLNGDIDDSPDGAVDHNVGQLHRVVGLLPQLPSADVYVFQEAREAWNRQLVDALTATMGRRYVLRISNTGLSMRTMVAYDEGAFIGLDGLDLLVQGATAGTRSPLLVGGMWRSTSQKLQIVGVHLAAFQSVDRVMQRRQQIDAFLGARQPGVPFVVVGDFNLGCAATPQGLHGCDANGDYLVANGLQVVLPPGGMAPTYCGPGYEASALDLVWVSAHAGTWQGTAAVLSRDVFCGNGMGPGAHVPVVAQLQWNP